MTEVWRRRASRGARIAALVALWSAPALLLRSAAVRGALGTAAEWMRAHGPSAIAVYAAAYALGSLVAAPMALMNAIAGFAYGPVVGVFVASSAAALATGVVHEVARRTGFARPPSEGSGKARLAIADRLLAKADLKSAMLLRASPPVPQNLLNYAFPFSGLGAPRAMLATLIGFLPQVAVHVYVGSLFANAVELFAHGTLTLPGPSWTPYAAGVIGVVLIGASALTLRAAARAEAVP